MKNQSKRVALYLRVSTDEQHVENQRQELTPWAEHAGHVVVSEFADEGVSGAKRREERPALNRLMKAAARREFDVVACWDVSRFGRSTMHMIELANELKQLGVGLYFHKDAVDMTTDHGQLVYMILAWVAEQERKRIVDRTKAGLVRARAQGKRIGRPPVAASIQSRAERLLLNGQSQRAVRRHCGLGSSTVSNIHKRLLAEGKLPT